MLGFGRPYGTPCVTVLAFPGRRPPRRTPAWTIFGASLRDACWARMLGVTESNRRYPTDSLVEDELTQGRLSVA